MKTKKYIGILALSLVLSSSPVFAQETTPLKSVTFKVTVGTLACDSGTGKSLVKFENTPVEGGYYEVTGDMITKNNIMLGREVELPSGTYFWSGIPQTGYATSTVSSGKFVVKECSKTVAPSVVKQQPAVTPTEEIKDVAVPTTVASVKTEPKDVVANIIQNMLGDMQKKIAGAVLVLVIIAGFFLRRRKQKNISKPSATPDVSIK